MKKIQILVMSMALVTVVACKNDTKKVEDDVVKEVEKVVEEVKEIKKDMAFELESKSGSSATGKVTVKEYEGHVTLEAQLFGLEKGTHAIHIHEKADCSSEDGKSSGGHWNPTFTPHGKWGDAGGFHLGDIGNFEVGDDGKGSIVLTTDKWCLGCGDEKKDILGKAIIVHKGADDFTSQPSGAAGARVSCGGIIQ